MNAIVSIVLDSYYTFGLVAIGHMLGFSGLLVALVYLRDAEANR
ncbi:hypothetical protein [Pseudopelagicola sp. nBUS_19]